MPEVGAPRALRQEWHDLLFAHWPVPATRMAQLLPRPLEPDTFDGEAWVGVVPFVMKGVRVRFLPALPGSWGEFPELNVRTYVRCGDAAGVHFFSLDADSRLAVALGRRAYGLPYRRARMHARRDGPGVDYRSERLDEPRPAQLVARYRPVGDPRRTAPGTLDHFLTARDCLFTVKRGVARRTDVSHPPWELAPAEAEIEQNTVAAAAGIELPDTPPLLHFSRRLSVAASLPREARLRGTR